MNAILIVLTFAAGYLAAVCSWPKVREIINGARAEAAALRARAAALEAKILGGARD
jgi:cell division septum initiation protein DivIVA